MTSEIFLLDEDSIRRQQADAASRAHARLIATVDDIDHSEAPGHSCRLLAGVFVEMLEGAGIRFADRQAAVAKIEIALWGGVGAVHAEINRDQYEAEDGDEDVVVSPVYFSLAAAYNLIGAIACAIGSSEPPIGLDGLAATLAEQLADEQLVSDSDDEQAN